MGKIKNIMAIIIVLIMINYTFYPVVFPTSLSNMNKGSELAKVSSNIFPDDDYIQRIELFNMGYGTLNRNIYQTGVNLSYYDFNHNLIWSRPINKEQSFLQRLSGSDQYLSSNYEYSNCLCYNSVYENATMYKTYKVKNRASNATIYNSDGDIVSFIPIELSTFDLNDSAIYNQGSSTISETLISNDRLYVVEFIIRQYQNNTGYLIINLHSYNIPTGKLEWIQNIARIDDGSEYSTPSYSVFDLNFDQGNLVLLVKSLLNELILIKYNIELDTNENITSIDDEIRNYDCKGLCTDVLILSFDEVISRSDEVDDDVRVSTFSSSKGSSLEISTLKWMYPDDYRSDYSGFRIYNYIKASADTLMLSGTMSIEPLEYTYYMAFLKSDSELSINIIDMNYTLIDNAISIDDHTILTRGWDLYDGAAEIVIWSLNRLEMLNFLNPSDKHMLPSILIILMISIVVIDKLRRPKMSQKMIEK